MFVFLDNCSFDCDNSNSSINDWKNAFDNTIGLANEPNYYNVSLMHSQYAFEVTFDNGKLVAIVFYTENDYSIMFDFDNKAINELKIFNSF